MSRIFSGKIIFLNERREKREVSDRLGKLLSIPHHVGICFVDTKNMIKIKEEKH
jgi:hypothetical protein